MTSAEIITWALRQRRQVRPAVLVLILYRGKPFILGVLL